MDPKTSRRWIAAAAAAAAVVFLVMATGETQPAPSSADPVLTAEGAATDGDSSQETEDTDAAGDDADVVEALQDLLDALGIQPEELVEEDGQGAQNRQNGQREQDNQRGNRAGNGADSAEDASITIDNFSFGQPITVAAGATVEVVNRDTATHNVTATDGAFETPNLQANDSATFTAPTTPGRYEFICTLHPEMTGTLIVEGSGNNARDDGDRNGGATSRQSSGTGAGAPTSSSNSGGSGNTNGRSDSGGATGSGSGNGY